MQYLRIEPVLGTAHLPCCTLALLFMTYGLLRQGRYRSGTSRQNSAITENALALCFTVGTNWRRIRKMETSHSASSRPNEQVPFVFMTFYRDTIVLQVSSPSFAEPSGIAKTSGASGQGQTGRWVGSCLFLIFVPKAAGASPSSRWALRGEVALAWDFSIQEQSCHQGIGINNCFKKKTRMLSTLAQKTLLTEAFLWRDGFETVPMRLCYDYPSSKGIAKYPSWESRAVWALLSLTEGDYFLLFFKIFL